jgi:spermidine synthase
MLLPTAFIGMTLPLLVRCAGASPARFGRNAGLVCAAHTLGAAAGALLGAYRLLPALGSLGSLRLLAALVLLVGAAAVVALSSHRGRWLAVGAGLVGAALGAWRPVAWDLEAWNGAAAIHLGHSTRGQGQRLYRREDPTGGLTTVVESRGVKTLLANGTFQGDDGEEVPVQHRLAHVPTLLTSGRERVLVIGLGTGVTLASIAAHGFEHAVCAEPSAPIVEAARAHFAGTNGGVLDRPSVELVRDDGPSVLLERGDLYDVVSVEARSIGLAGAGAVKSDDFYRLVSRRLKRHGVLLQRFPMRPLSARSLFTVVSAVRSVFPHVSVWNHRRQGFVVASNEPLAVDVASVRADLAREGLRPYLRELASGSPLEVLGDLVVAEVDEDRFLDGMAEPTGTFLDFQDRATLRRVRSPRPLPFRGEPLAAERSLVEAAFVHGWSDPRALAQLALTWAADASESRVASRYLLDELTGDEVEGGGPDEDPVAGLRQASPALSAMIAAAAPAAECRPAPAFVTDPRAPHRTLLDSRGLTLAPTQPEEAIDDRATPDWGEGWRVRPEGAPPWIEMAFDRPLLLDTVHVVVRPIDGSVVRARLYGRGAGGRWRPLASGGQVEDMACRDMRVYHLAPAPEPLVALGVEFQGEALSDRIAVHEVWAVERR